MKSHLKPVTRKIREIEAALRWPLLRTRHRNPLDIISDPYQQTHTIRFDEERGGKDPVRPIEYLHELGHAWLAEREPVFCVHDFIAPSSAPAIENALRLVSDPVRATADWFVDALVLRWAPVPQKDYIVEHVNLVRRSLAQSPSPDPDLAFAAAHILAQGIAYFGIKIPYPPFLHPDVSLYLTVDPFVPTEDNFAALFNSLLSARGLSAAWSPEERAWIITRTPNP